ncbi:DNA methyltransferase [Mesorhizobium sp.]|uniref:DNA methyltransferase n=1 Tax=Mesorhizobium sp. TaxID=1871066 RepID=UPI00257FB806|nr:DNA methyltransferase [Mesorhizobium sp.]
MASEEKLTVAGLNILSPKRNKRLQSGWEGFFPYYAGYPELFARELLRSAQLPDDAVVLDPWNGSGTTTYAANQLGLNSIGIDLNPVMIIVARARLLAPSEADHLRPLAANIMWHAHASPTTLADDDALLDWYNPATARFIRGIEQNIRRSLLGSMTRSPDGINLDRISGTAATMYVALFAACRRLAAPFRSSNPTWLRMPKSDADRIDAPQTLIARYFADNVGGLSDALVAQQDDLLRNGRRQPSQSEIALSNTTTMDFAAHSIDFVLTSPPYCTRIDYTAATRIELAVLSPLLKTTARSLGKQMIGSTQVPNDRIQVDPAWGATCVNFLEALKKHPSKASSGYYYRTHLDYFDKMSRSLARVSRALKPGARAIFVVQDSHYKELHNDLPTIITELCDSHGLRFEGRQNFRFRSMSDINPGRKSYQRPAGATETVLCFAKDVASALGPRFADRR